MKKVRDLLGGSGFCVVALCCMAVAHGCRSRGEDGLVLQYDAPARYFEESLVIGNGTLGAIIYGGVDSDKVALNDITLWTGEPEGEPYAPGACRHLPEVRALLDAEDYAGAQEANKMIEGHDGQYYQPLGTLYIRHGSSGEANGSCRESNNLCCEPKNLCCEANSSCRGAKGSCCSASASSATGGSADVGRAPCCEANGLCCKSKGSCRDSKSSCCGSDAPRREPKSPCCETNASCCKSKGSCREANGSCRGAKGSCCQSSGSSAPGGRAAWGYHRSLDISRAIARDGFRTDEGSFAREYFASAPDSVIVIRLTASDGAELHSTLAYECAQPHETIAEGDELTIRGYTAYGYDEALDGSPEAFLYDPSRGIHFQTIVKAIPDGGSVVAVGGSLRISGCRTATLLISNVTSFNGPHKDPVREGRDCASDVRKRIDKAATKGYKALKAAHESDYAALFGRLGIDLGDTDPTLKSLATDRRLLQYGDFSQPDPDLEELNFQYGRYLLISSSRTPGVPANLQGLWNEKVVAPWRSNYTMNINLEENYWPAEPANLSEMHSSLLEFVERLTVSGRVSAENYYGVGQGWSAGHNSDIWAMTNPVKGRPRWACWPMGSAWLSTHIWERYAFTMDRDFLARAYPTLKGAAEFCLGWLIEKDGWLMTSPSTSPEADFINPQGTATATLYGGTADLAFVRECLMDTRAAAEVLGVDEELRGRIDSTLSRLLPYRIGKRGNLQEWYHDWEDADWHHRHQSHLFGLYPGHHISPGKTPELAAACARTLEIKGDKTTGWSTGWRVNLQARLLDAEKAYHMYRTLLTYVSPDGYEGEDARRGGGTYPNLLDAHSPFQIDGNFGGCAGVLEMLVQSDMEEGVTLLPALPQAWSAHGALRGVRARGGWELDFSWKDGRVTDVRVRSLRPDAALFRLHANGACHELHVAPGESRRIRF